MTLPAYHLTFYSTTMTQVIGVGPAMMWGMTRALPRIVGRTNMSFRANVRMGSCARVYLLAQKRMRWVFLRGFAVFYYCATAPRLRSYLAQTVAKFDIIVGVLLWPNQVRPLHDNMSSCFHVVFTNHDEGWCPLIVCDIT